MATTRAKSAGPEAAPTAGNANSSSSGGAAGDAKAPGATSAPSAGWTRLPSSASLFRTDSLGLGMDPGYDIMYGNLPLRSPPYSSIGPDGMTSYFPAPPTPSNTVVNPSGAAPSSSSSSSSTSAFSASGVPAPDTDNLSALADDAATASSKNAAARPAAKRAPEGWRRITPAALALPLPGLKPAGPDNLSLLPSPGLITPNGLDNFVPSAVRRPLTRSGTDGGGAMGEFNEKESDAATILQAISSPPIVAEENLFEKNLGMMGIKAPTPGEPNLIHSDSLNEGALARRAGSKPRGRGRVVEAVPTAAAVAAAAANADAASVASMAGAAAAANAGYFPLMPSVSTKAETVEALGLQPRWAPPVNIAPWSLAGADSAGSASDTGGDARMPRKRKGEQEDLDLLEQKRQRRRERCREAATKFRVKKRREVQELEQQAAGAQIAHAQLVQEVTTLKQRVADLRAFAAMHRECPGIAHFRWPAPASGH